MKPILPARPAEDTRAALRVLRPQLAEPRDYQVAADGSIKWTAPARFVQPTPEECAQALAASTAKRQQIEGLRASLLSVYASMPPGEQAFYAGAFERVAISFRSGDVAAARATIATSPAPTESLVATKQAMLDLFPTE